MTASSAATAPTRDRILDAAMRLFSEQGFKGTSITQIEAAAGLTPGAGGIYHHFPSKQALLSAGVQRHIARLQALRDIRNLLTDLGDVRVELTLLARYILAELDREQELLRIAATEARTQPELIAVIADELVGASYAGFATWLEAAGVSSERARAVGAVGLGALLSSRLLVTLGLGDPSGVDDERFIASWVAMMLSQIDQASA